MTTSVNPTHILKEELDKLSWPELRSKAVKQYAIRLSPEHTAHDIKRLILDKAAGVTKYVTDDAPLENKSAKYGWSRVKVLQNTRDNDKHCKACHNGFQFAVPYNVEVNLPTITCEYLESKYAPIMKNNDDMSDGWMEHEPRWTVIYLEKNYGPNGEADYVPPDQRHKYWTEARERKLGVKRAFMDEMGFWPTDKKLKEYTINGMFNRNSTMGRLQEASKVTAVAGAGL